MKSPRSKDMASAKHVSFLVQLLNFVHVANALCRLKLKFLTLDALKINGLKQGHLQSQWTIKEITP
jgi:hypothetical protein